MREINRLSAQQWLRSAISDSQQPISPIGFLFSKLPPPLCAVLLVYIYILSDSEQFLIHKLGFDGWVSMKKINNSSCQFFVRSPCSTVGSVAAYFCVYYCSCSFFYQDVALAYPHIKSDQSLSDSPPAPSIPLPPLKMQMWKIIVFSQGRVSVQGFAQPAR